LIGFVCFAYGLRFAKDFCSVNLEI